MIYTASCGPDGFDMQRFIALHTVLTYEGLQDCLECQAVDQSWADASYFNARDTARDGRG